MNSVGQIAVIINFAIISRTEFKNGVAFVHWSTSHFLNLLRPLKLINARHFNALTLIGHR